MQSGMLKNMLQGTDKFLVPWGIQIAVPQMSRL